MTGAPADLSRRLAEVGVDGLEANIACALGPATLDFARRRALLFEVDSALAAAPRDASLHALRGKLLCELGETAAARPSLDRAAALAPGDERTRAWRGALALLEGDAARALKDLGSGGSGWTAFYRGAALFSAGSSAAAETELGVAAEGAGESALAARFLLALLRASQGRETGVALERDAAASPAVAALARRWSEELYRLGGAHAAAGRRAEAETALRGCLALVPGRVEAAWDLAGLVQDSGRNDEYISLAEDLLARGPERIDGRLNLVRALVRRGLFEKARAALLPAAQARPDDREVAFLEGRVASAEGALDRAEAAYRRAAALDPRRHETWFHLAEVLQRLGRDEDTFAALADAARAVGAPAEGDARALLDAFRLAFLRQEYAEAASLGEKVSALTRSLEHLEALRWPSFIEEFDLTYGTDAYHRRALERLTALAAAKPRSPWFPYYRVIFASSLATRLRDAAGSVERAALEKLVLADAAKVRRLAGKSVAWMRVEPAKRFLYDGKLREALAEFRLVADSVPENYVARCQAGEILFILGRRKAAVAAFEEALRAAPERSKGDVLAWRSELRLWLGDFEGAVASADEALARGHQYGHCWKGGALVKLGRFAEALVVLDRAVAVSPWDMEARVWRSEALLRLGRHAEAAAEAETVVADRAGANQFGHMLLYLALDALGDPARARGAIDARAKDLPVAMRFETAKDLRALFERDLARAGGMRRWDYSRAAWMKGRMSA